MHAAAVLTTLLLLPAYALASAQVNFYWDSNCQEYAGTSAADLNGDVVGGPAGSNSMLFVTLDENSCNPSVGGICFTALFCKNPACDAYDIVPYFEPQLGQVSVCKSFENGVWAAERCGDICPQSEL